MNKFLSDILDMEFSHSLDSEPSQNDLPDIQFLITPQNKKSMNRAEIGKLYKKYGLSENDVYKHKHYLIITRQGIEKIQAQEKINISYDVVECQPLFAAVKARAEKDGNKIETFGSALHGETYKDGNTTTFYVIEMAEKRAMSRAVLKLTGFYELGVFGEDESEDFKKQ